MSINLTLWMQAIAFAVFIGLCAKFIWPPIMRAIETRQKEIADGLAAGEEGRQSLSRAEKEIGRLMTEARTRAAEIIAQGEKLRSETVEHAKGEAKAEASRILAAAKAEITQEATRAKEMLRDQVAELAVAGAEKILRREVDASKHAEMLASIQKQL